MSDPNANVMVLRVRRSQRDRGMTLPELLIAVTMIGLIITVLSATVIVTMKQQGGTTGRLSVAHAEQTVGMWIPADLASADDVSTDPWASPCGAPVCSGIDLSTGSNVLMLTWTVDGVTTNVSYHFRPQGDGLYELIRVQCIGSSCASQPMLRDLPGPPAGQPFVPGVGTGATVCQQRDGLPTPDPARPACTRPSWVITVSAPLAADAIGEAPIANPAETKDANRVIVTVNGGGDAAGAGGGINQISITAGGTTRREIDANSLLGAPSLVAARSRCGGLITLIVDESGSIGGNISNVRTAVRGFVNALIGTPVKIQLVQFDTVARVQTASGTTWRRYYDMTKAAEVTELTNNVNALTTRSYTNWEEAWYRTFFDPESGSTPPRVASVLPETVVFFTDGIPNLDRRTNKASGSSQDPLPALPTLDGTQWGTPADADDFNTVSFARAEYIASLFRTDVRLIGVGVGAFGTNVTSPYVITPRQYYRYETRPNWTYQRRASWTWESRVDYERITAYSSTMDPEVANSGWATTNRFQTKVDWQRKDGTDIDIVTYDGLTAANRSIGSTTRSSWTTVTPALYDKYVATAGTAAQWRINGTVASQPVTEPLYVKYNTTDDDSDLWTATWTDTDIATYYGSSGNSANPHKYRINTTNRSAYTITSAVWDAYSANSPAHFSVTWSDTDAATYAANVGAEPTHYRTNGSRASWSTITEAIYDAYNTTRDSSDNYRKTNPSGAWEDTSKADYDLHETTAGTNDGYQKINPTGNWVQTTQADYDYYQNGTAVEKSGYQRPYVTSGNTDGYTPEVYQNRRNDAIITQLITGVGPNSDGTPSTPALRPEANGEYDLEKVQLASMFLPSDWGAPFQKVLKAIALGECGGTLTMQTRSTATNAPVGDPFTYQNTWLQLAGGARENSVLSVTTNLASVASPFDFSIPSGQYVDVGVELQNFDELSGYAFDHWECSAGGVPRSAAPEFTQVGGSPQWPGMSVRIQANEAVSCIQWVRKL